MYDYEHTQPAKVLNAIWGAIVIVLVGVVVFLVSRGVVEAAYGIAIPLTILIVVMCLFHSLTVRVSQNEISLSFGIGLIQKAFLIDEIDSSAVVQNRWYHGWGIKKISGGWLFNVSGFDAIELRMKNGKLYRSGTDQPAELLTAIESAVGQRND